MELYLIKEDAVNITDITGGIVLNTSMDTLGASLNFNIARNFNDPNYALAETLEVGDIVILNNSKELFKGVILEITTNKFNKNIKCLDFCFYLNKNKVVKQFDEISASTAIKQVLKEIGADIGEISTISTSITKIYNSNTIAEIINDILKQANDELGIKYIIEFAEDKFNIVPFRKVNVQFRYKSTSSESLTESILEMKNSIIVTSNEQEEIEILAVAKDEANIERYGSLQEVITVNPDEDEAKVRNIAKTKLKELNKVFRTAALQGFGDDEFKAGRVIELNNQEFFLQGEYLIKNCSHTWVKGEHLVNLEVELYEE
ncbi:XkdQ/YqbQ family protein [Fusobacterium ulcerans]|uniref:YqbQ/XkdQ domain-containing protein n=1 Tax=Fusobacterium ulcerans 12-1B TaxID=457404 RepID=H1PTQ6_9FUSO|nr:hypothetical protein [Fusobacterium ulcerans]EHO80726.1 hypothetical protein HMPREF0402_01799 [Fusobacterium ulcerans 12-1B]